MSELWGGGAEIGWAVVKVVVLFLVAVVGLRFAERRTLAQLGAFDFAAAAAVGAIIGRTATTAGASVAVGAAALVALLAVHRTVAALRRHDLLRRLVDQPPLVLIANGRPAPRALRRAGLTRDDVLALLREHGVADPREVRYLLYETRGAVTVVRAGEPVGPTVSAALEEVDASAPPRDTPLRDPTPRE